ncbi:MAG: WcaF family extracellular polysaccharide biosynthesis acetyltransferase [Candidatus Binataceae bacterium]
MRLDRFDTGSFSRGRPAWVEALWLLCQALLLNSWLPGSAYRVFLLRLFGAKIGGGVVIKPHVRVKFPWRLVIGDYSWIGEDAWIDNLAEVRIGSHCCLSQGVYLCTGSHDWASERFDLETSPITIGDHVWLGARTSVAPGVSIGDGAVLTMGSVATKSLSAWCIHSGAAAESSKPRCRVTVVVADTGKTV